MLTSVFTLQKQLQMRITAKHFKLFISLKDTTCQAIRSFALLNVTDCHSWRNKTHFYIEFTLIIAMVK